jgi:hypothetical protein
MLKKFNRMKAVFCEKKEGISGPFGMWERNITLLLATWPNGEFLLHLLQY